MGPPEVGSQGKFPPGIAGKRGWEFFPPGKTPGVIPRGEFPQNQRRHRLQILGKRLGMGKSGLGCSCRDHTGAGFMEQGNKPGNCVRFIPKNSTWITELCGLAGPPSGTNTTRSHFQHFAPVYFSPVGDEILGISVEKQRCLGDQ